MLRRNSLLAAALMGFMFTGLASAQAWGGPGHGPGGMMGGPPQMERAFHDQHFGRWWNDPHLAQELNITSAQKQTMDQIFQQHLLNLIDLKASLEKQQVQLGPMISADNPNETAVLAQIDKIAQARANLEKANARMLFDIRKTLTPEQWQKLKAMHQDRRMERRDHRMDRRGRGAWKHGQAPGAGPGQQAAPPPPPNTSEGTPQPPPPPQ